MEYLHTCRGIFLSRPNRFLARVLVDGGEQVCHVRNTGRCRELLIPGVEVIVCREENPNRKTAYSLLAVYKGERLINIDSQAPNRAVREWLEKGGFISLPCTVRPESKWGESRFDFLLEKDNKRCYLEVKGVTLEQDHTVYFPDAPTVRGTKHLRELVRCAGEGMDAAVLFVVQMQDVARFRPNWQTDPEFSRALREAASLGVQVLAYDCRVTERSMEIADPVQVDLNE